MNTFRAWTLCTASGEFVYLHMSVPAKRATSVHLPSYVRPVILLFNTKTTASNFKKFHGQTIRTSYCVHCFLTDNLSILRRPSMKRDDAEVEVEVGVIDDSMYTDEFMKKLITAYAVFYVVEKYSVRRGGRVSLVGAMHDPANSIESSVIHATIVEGLNDTLDL